jgi:hypothetical protein
MQEVLGLHALSTEDAAAEVAASPATGHSEAEAGQTAKCVK